MDSNKPAITQVGGTKVSRRTIARGAAWSVPIAAVATSAPAFAASCVPVISFDQGRSCKCPGQSVDGEEFRYYLAFCVTNACVVGSGSGGTFVVTSVTKANGGAFANDPNSCFPAVLGQTSTQVNACTTDVYRFEADNSSNFVVVNFSVTVNGATTNYSQQLPSPPFCDCKKNAAQCADGRCRDCV